MPEIPEMELYKDNLNRTVRDKVIQEIWIYRAKSINYEAESFINKLLGQMITSVERKGKYLIFHISNGLKLLAHMMLDGRLYYLSPEHTPLEKSDYEEVDKLREKIPGLSGKPSVLFKFIDQSQLFFCQLTLGYLRMYEDKELAPILGELGPDPLDCNFGPGDFSLLLGKGSKRSMIKPWLMQPKNIAGVGNAYSNESLFRASILPTRTLGTIGEEERVKLFQELKAVLEESIRLGGDMEEPFSPEDTFTGGFNPYFQVYDREGKECLRCSHLIVKEEVGGRNAFFCPNCQH